MSNGNSPWYGKYLKRIRHGVDILDQLDEQWGKDGYDTLMKSKSELLLTEYINYVMELLEQAKGEDIEKASLALGGLSADDWINEREKT